MNKKTTKPTRNIWKKKEAGELKRKKKTIKEKIYSEKIRNNGHGMKKERGRGGGEGEGGQEGDKRRERNKKR